MFALVAKLVEREQRIVPSLVRFQSFDAFAVSGREAPNFPLGCVLSKRSFRIE